MGQDGGAAPNVARGPPKTLTVPAESLQRFLASRQGMRTYGMVRLWYYEPMANL